MAITYDPSSLLKKIAPEAKIKKMLTGELSLKKTALNFTDAVDFIDRKSVSKVALKTVRGYQERVAKAQADAGLQASAGDAVEAGILKDPKQLIQRVHNELIFQIKESIKENYSGEQYEWLPSDAEEPDPEHQLNYGEIFTVGEGEMPGDRYGCLCGMRILVKQTELELT